MNWESNCFRDNCTPKSLKMSHFRPRTHPTFRLRKNISRCTDSTPLKGLSCPIPASRSLNSKARISRSISTASEHTPPNHGSPSPNHLPLISYHRNQMTGKYRVAGRSITTILTAQATASTSNLHCTTASRRKCSRST